MTKSTLIEKAYADLLSGDEVAELMVLAVWEFKLLVAKSLIEPNAYA